MKTFRSAPIALLGLVLAIALVGPSCSSANPVALQVGDWQLSSSTFQDQLTSYADAVESAGGSRSQFEGTTAGTWSTSFTSQLLGYHLDFQLAQQAVQDRGLTVTDADRDDMRTNLESSASNSSAVFKALPADMQDQFVAGFAAENALSADLVKNGTSDEALRAVFDSSGDAYRDPQACVSHILVFAGNADGKTTPSDADYAAALTKVQQLESGLTVANFADVARASSEDSGSASQGGDLGCAPAGAYVREFDNAVWSQPIGEVGQPVKTIYGYHVILVRSRGVLTFEDVKSTLAQQVASNPQALVQAELARLAKETTVTVDGRYGDFDADTGKIVAPAGPSQPSTTLAVDSLLGSGTSGQ